MTQQLHQQANALLYQALEQPAPDRRSFLAQACQGRADLLALVNTMLSHIDQLDAFLEQPLAMPHAPAQASAEARPQAGDLLGGWRVVRELERGKLGAILLVERSEGDSRQIAALKIVDDEALSLDELALFHHQRQLLASLTHPQVARLIDSGSLADGRPYFVVEYSDGIPLDEFCNEAGLRARARVRLVIQVCKALHHAHQRLVVHRHLHPSNILVDQHGALKVADLGIASLFDRADPADGDAIGADIRGLGMLLRDVVPTLDGDLEAIADCACELAPGQRYASADELARDLQRFLEHRTTMARPGSTLARGRKWMRRHRIASAAAVLVLVPLLGCAALGAYTLGTDRQLQQRIERAFGTVRAKLAPSAAKAAAPAATTPSASVQPPTAPDQPAEAPDAKARRLMEQGQPDQALAVLRAALPVHERAGAAPAVAATHRGMAQALSQQGEYADADEEFTLARAAYAALPEADYRDEVAEIDLERAHTQLLRKHGKTAGQTVRALLASLAPRDDSVLKARAQLLQALIQPGGTAAQAYAAAQKALPSIVTDSIEPEAQRRAAMAWRHTGEIGLRAGQKVSACGYLNLAEKRYADLDAAQRTNALDKQARAELTALRAPCAQAGA